jgi:hypothetical protein
MNRRKFIQLLLAGFASAYSIQQAKALFYTNEDKEIFTKKITWIFKNNLHKLPTNKLIICIAESFIGANYKADTLNIKYPEELIVNLREFDCVTFIENVLAICLCIKSNQLTFQDFCKQLTFIRYRQHTDISYSSRLHYFVDWLSDGEKKGFLTNTSGPSNLKKELNLLSQNLALPEEVALIQNQEKLLSIKELNYFDKKSLEKTETKKFLESGDIIGFVAQNNNIDYTHTAFLLQEKNDEEFTFIHASSLNKKVEIYKGSLNEYLRLKTKNLGISLARINSRQ